MILEPLPKKEVKLNVTHKLNPDAIEKLSELAIFYAIPKGVVVEQLIVKAHKEHEESLKTKEVESEVI